MLHAPAVHWANLDRLRVLAIIDITMYHADFGRPRLLLGLGLPVFLIAAVFLPAQRSTLPSWPSVVGPRVKRVLLPWVFWSAVYAVALQGQARMSTGSWPGWPWFDPSMMFYGTATHLWFLPFIFLAAVAVRCVLPAVRRMRWPIIALVGLVGGLGLASVSPPGWLGYPFSTWWFSLPGLVIGLALGRLALAGQLCHRRAYVIAGAAVGGSVAWLMWLGLEPATGRYALAGALVVLSLGLTWPDDPISRTLSGCVYGVYLIHPLVFVLTHEVIDGPSYPLLVAVGLIGATALTLLCQRLPVLKQMV